MLKQFSLAFALSAFAFVACSDDSSSSSKPSEEKSAESIDQKLDPNP